MQQHFMDGDGVSPELFKLLAHESKTNLRAVQLPFKVPDTIVYNGCATLWYYWSNDTNSLQRYPAKALEKTTIYRRFTNPAFVGGGTTGLRGGEDDYDDEDHRPLGGRWNKGARASTGGGLGGDSDEDAEDEGESGSSLKGYAKGKLNAKASTIVASFVNTRPTLGSSMSSSVSAGLDIAFFTRESLRRFLNSDKKYYGILQMYIAPRLDHSEVVQVMHSKAKTFAIRRVNKAKASDATVLPAVRCCTFDGPTHQCDEHYCLPNVTAVYTALCVRFTEFFANVNSKHSVERLVAYFKQDKKKNFWLLFTTAIRVAEMSPSERSADLRRLRGVDDCPTSRRFGGTSIKASSSNTERGRSSSRTRSRSRSAELPSKKDKGKDNAVATDGQTAHPLESGTSGLLHVPISEEGRKLWQRFLRKPVSKLGVDSTASGAVGGDDQSFSHGPLLRGSNDESSLLSTPAPMGSVSQRRQSAVSSRAASPVPSPSPASASVAAPNKASSSMSPPLSALERGSLPFKVVHTRAFALGDPEAIAPSSPKPTSPYNGEHLNVFPKTYKALQLKNLRKSKEHNEEEVQRYAVRGENERSGEEATIGRDVADREERKFQRRSYDTEQEDCIESELYTARGSRTTSPWPQQQRTNVVSPVLCPEALVARPTTPSAGGACVQRSLSLTSATSPARNGRGHNLTTVGSTYYSTLAKREQEALRLRSVVSCIQRVSDSLMRKQSDARQRSNGDAGTIRPVALSMNNNNLFSHTHLRGGRGEGRSGGNYGENDENLPYKSKSLNGSATKGTQLCSAASRRPQSAGLYRPSAISTRSSTDATVPIIDPYWAVTSYSDRQRLFSPEERARRQQQQADRLRVRPLSARLGTRYFTLTASDHASNFDDDDTYGYTANSGGVEADGKGDAAESCDSEVCVENRQSCTAEKTAENRDSQGKKVGDSTKRANSLSLYANCKIRRAQQFSERKDTLDMETKEMDRRLRELRREARHATSAAASRAHHKLWASSGLPTSQVSTSAAQKGNHGWYPASDEDQIDLIRQRLKAAREEQRGPA